MNTKRKTRTQYEVTTTWTGVDGNDYSSVDVISCSAKVLAEQVEQQYRWHAAHNHINVTVTTAVR